MENSRERLERFLNGDYDEIPLTLIDTIRERFLPVLAKADENRLDELLLPGIHSVIQTIGQHIYGRRGLDATNFYLQHFVDGKEEHLKFSAIAEQLHELRNVFVHQLFSKLGHEFSFDYRVERGWWKNDSKEIHFNPAIYCRCFMSGYDRTKEYRTWLSDWDLLKVKYRYIVAWGDLKQNDPLRMEMENILSASTYPEALVRSQTLQAKLSKR